MIYINDLLSGYVIGNSYTNPSQIIYSVSG